VLDGEVLGQDGLIARLGADVVGVGPTILTYRNALSIATRAKAMRAQVVFGGHHATALASKVLTNRHEIDFVVRYDGEATFANLLCGRSAYSLPNIAWRSADTVVFSQAREADVRTTRAPRRDCIEPAPYWRNWRNQHPTSPFTRPASICSQKGCPWKVSTGGCILCGRTAREWRVRPPSDVWNEVTGLVHDYGTDFIWDTSDSILSSRQWFETFVRAKPRNIDPAFLFFARVDEIDATTVRHLARVNAYEVFLGIESGDSRILKQARKGTTVRQNLAAARSLASAGIRVFPSLVLGLPGECRESLLNSLLLVRELLALGNVDALSVSVLMPLPGSPALDLILSVPELAAKYGNADDFELESLQRDWVKHFCAASFDELLQMREEMFVGVPTRSGHCTKSPTFSASRSVDVA
jgi:radical SAM superfamily enzyme YgiQ (UPF0313 family)